MAATIPNYCHVSTLAAYHDFHKHTIPIKLPSPYINPAFLSRRRRSARIKRGFPLPPRVIKKRSLSHQRRGFAWIGPKILRQESRKTREKKRKEEEEEEKNRSHKGEKYLLKYDESNFSCHSIPCRGHARRISSFKYRSRWITICCIEFPFSFSFSNLAIFKIQWQREV